MGCGTNAFGAHVVLLDGIPLNACSETELVETVVAEACAGRGGWVVTANVDIVRSLRRSDALRSLVRPARLVVADGMPLVWAARLQGAPLPGRVTGSSLIWTMSAAAAGRLSVFLLGGPPGSAPAAAEQLLRLNPALQIVGARSPSMGFERDPTEVADVLEHVAAAAPDVVFCGLGFPKQEQMIARLRVSLPRTWFVGCGAAIAFAGGVQQRAPRWMGEHGLEWLHRLSREPRRLFGRYVVVDAPYACALLARSAAVYKKRTLSPQRHRQLDSSREPIAAVKLSPSGSAPPVPEASASDTRRNASASR